MNMLNSSAANIEPAVSTQTSSPTKTNEIRSADLVLASDNARKTSMPESVSLPEVEEIVTALNDHMDMLKTTLGFSIDKNAEKIVVTVKNRVSDEVIRQIPAEELLTIQAKMEELSGLILNKEV